MELINGIDIQNGMIFGPTIDDSPTDMIIEFNAQGDYGNVFIFDIFVNSEGNVKVTIDWDDGNVESFDQSFDVSAYHEYASSGTKFVKIYGTEAGGINFDNYGKPQLIGVHSWGNLPFEFMTFTFYGCYNLLYVPNYLPPTVTDCESMFNACYVMNDSNVSTWNTSNVTTMFKMFEEAFDFNQNIGSWDTSNVLTMQDMFAAAFSFNGNIASWNTANVTDMSGMFSYAYSFNSNIGSWNVGNVTDMVNMFYDATIFNQDLTGWCVSNIVSEPFQFSLGSALTNENKPLWGTCP